MTELICCLCDRQIPQENLSEKHHLIPKQKGGKKQETILVCLPCGDQIHKLFSNYELKKVYNSLEALKNSDRLQKWIKWIRKRDFFYVCMKTKKRR